MYFLRRPKVNPVQEVNENLLESLVEAEPVDQMDFLRQKINSHQGPVGDFTEALEGNLPQVDFDIALIEGITYLIRHGLVVRIAGSHPAGPGSIPGGGIIF